MKRAAVLIILLLSTMVPATVMAEEAIATIHITAGQPKSFQVESAKIYWDGIFKYSPGSGWEAEFHAVFTDGTGFNHSVIATESGEIDAENHYRWVLKSVQTDDSIESKSLGLFESWYSLSVELIDPISEKVVISDDYDGKTYTLYVGDKVEIHQLNSNEKTVLELSDIETSLFGSKAKLTIHHITAVSGVVELYPPQQGQAPSENQTNETPTPEMPAIDPTKVPAVMIVVGEHAAGADVAAGAKVGIAVQKWIDESDSLVEMLPVPSTFVKMYKEAKKTMIRADAMLDTEVQDPNKIALIVYSVGGPAANQYSAMLNEKDIPVKFVKENGKWYLVSKYGKKWNGSYGVIEIIPAARTIDDMKRNLMNGNIKMYDVLVAGLDRKGTYAACKLLNTNFMGMLKGEKPSEEILPLITLQAQITNLFSGYIFIDQTTAIAIIVDENGKIVKVITG